MIMQALIDLFGGIFAFVGHISGGNSFPEPLSPQEEKDCIERLEKGDEEARRLLIEHNLRLVAHIAKKYSAPRRDADDVISIGIVGLIKAVSTFNSQKGNTLATYAARCIENEILMCIRSTRKIKAEVSLNVPIGVDKDGNSISFDDILGTDPDDILNRLSLKIQISQLLKSLDVVLTEREKQIVVMRYGIRGSEAKTQREIAAELGISRSYVSRIEKKIKAKFKEEYAK